MIIFGIDPGTATTGYGVIKTIKGKKGTTEILELVDYGCVVTPKEQEMPLRLLSIQKDINRLLRQYKPDCVSIEQLFFGINSRTAMTVGQARGVVMAAAAGNRVPIFEYQGLHVKSVISGSGKADKKEIQKHVMKHLNKRKLEKPAQGFIDDAADALAVAICHYIKVSNVSKESKVSNGVTAKNDKKLNTNGQVKNMKNRGLKVNKVSKSFRSAASGI